MLLFFDGNSLHQCVCEFVNEGECVYVMVSLRMCVFTVNSMEEYVLMKIIVCGCVCIVLC